MFVAATLAAILAGLATAVGYRDGFSSLEEELGVDHVSTRMYCPYVEGLLISFFQVVLLVEVEGELFLYDHLL